MVMSYDISQANSIRGKGSAASVECEGLGRLPPTSLGFKWTGYRTVVCPKQLGPKIYGTTVETRALISLVMGVSMCQIHDGIVGVVGNFHIVACYSIES